MSDHGMSDVEWLVAIEQIRQLKARRDRALDRKDWDAFRATHWPEHISETTGSTTTLDETITFLDSGLRLVDTTHHSHSPEITFSSATEAKGIWMMEDMLYWNQGEEAHWLHGYGYYHETYLKRDGEWRVIHRSLERSHVHLSPGATLSDHSSHTPRPNA